MRNICIVTIITLLLVLGKPLLGLRDNYKTMEYEEIGDTMLDNVNPYIDLLHDTADLSNTLLDFGSGVLKTIKSGIDFITKILTDFWNWLPDWITGKEEDSLEIICTTGENGQMYCQYEDGTPYYGENGGEVGEAPCTGLTCTI